MTVAVKKRIVGLSIAEYFFPSTLQFTQLRHVHPLSSSQWRGKEERSDSNHA